MTVDRKRPDYLPIPTKQEHPTHPGRTLETAAERDLRYEAQLISQRAGIPLSQAMEIARLLAAEREKAHRRQESRIAREWRLKSERQHDKSKRDATPIVKTHGPPMPGGAPGLGKQA